MFSIHNKVQRIAAKLKASARLAELQESKSQICRVSPNIHNSSFCQALLSSLLFLILTSLLSKQQNTCQVKWLMQMADKQPCKKPARKAHPASVRKVATWDLCAHLVLSLRSKPYTSLSSVRHVLQGWWGWKAASQLLPADRHAQHSFGGQTSLTSSGLYGLQKCSGTLPGKGTQLGQQGCRAKAVNPHTHRASLKKIVQG